jgi:hypothetical protein
MIRGLFTHSDTLYAVIDDTLYSVASNGVRSSVGTLNSTAGVVDFAATLTQLVITDGGYLYVYTPSTSTFTTVGSNYTGGERIAFVDQRIVFLYNGTQRFGWTALEDATSIDPLDFASAEGSPDPIVSMLADHRELWLFGTNSTEIWNSVGGSEVFARNPSAFIEYGCAATHSAQKSANSVTWLSRDERGDAMVMRAQGYQPQRISTRAIEERFQGLDISSARAYTYSDGGQQFYCLNVPNVETTLIYDETFQQWHERAELVNGNYRHWRPTCHAFAYGKHFFGANDGKIYSSDYEEHTFGGSVKCRDRITPVVSADNRKRLRFSMVEVLCEKATAATVLLRWSDDNGANWSNWQYASTGPVGTFSRRIRWHRTGSAYDRVYQVRVTDDAPFNPVSMIAEAL